MVALVDEQQADEETEPVRGAGDEDACHRGYLRSESGGVSRLSGRRGGLTQSAQECATGTLLSA